MNLLVTVHKNGVVNQFQIVENTRALADKTQVQLIWNDQIHCTIIGQNYTTTVHDTKNRWLIKHYRAIYLNGIQIVKHGKVWPRQRFLDRIKALIS